MSEPTVVHVFGPDDLLELERIVVDEDRDAALTFLREVRAALQQRQAHHCRPVFEWSDRQPGQWVELQTGGSSP